MQLLAACRGPAESLMHHCAQQRIWISRRTCCREDTTMLTALEMRQHMLIVRQALRMTVCRPSEGISAHKELGPQQVRWALVTDGS
jgi:hypothetical protein